MKKILSVIILSVFVVVSLFSAGASYAQVQQQPGGPVDPGPGSTPDDARWVIDPEVTFIGKNARRAGDFLDWTLKNYNWVCVNKVNERQCDDSNNPIAQYWSLIVLYIVVPMLFVVVLATSAVIIITRGKSLTIMRFIPRFVVVVVLIVFSYSMVQFFYQFFDLIQGFFLRSDINNPCPPDCIQQTDLLYVGWNYETFVGLRLLGDKYAESAFMSLLLTKLTALTYFVMTFLLLVRKIILWFFIIVSPVFPILLLFYPVRNTAKIWIGEFFRWLLYAPLFAIFLNGLVYLWRNKIPLNFVNANINDPNFIVFPTAVNILLGGPQQFVTPTNSVNLIETFALYVVSLIMLWIVILLPWILLQIFLDYASNFSPGDSAAMKTIVNMANAKKPPPTGGVGPIQPTDGMAVSLPFSKKFSIPKDLQPTGSAKELMPEKSTIQATFATPTFTPTANINAEVLSLANVKMPSMRDIAKYDTAMISRDQSKTQEVSRMTKTLERIANPVSVTNTVEREQVSQIREKITEKSEKGNNVATSILKASSVASNTKATTKQVKDTLKQIANPALAPATNREKMSKLHDMMKKESTQNNNQVASSVLSVTDKTSDKEVEKINSQLSKTQNSTVSKSVNSAIKQSAQQSNQLQSVIKSVSKADTTKTTGKVSAADKQQVAKLKTTLEKASKEGNQLATSILSVNEKTSVSEIEALQQKIQEAQEKGEPIATEVASLAKETGQTNLPSMNRVQTVSKEDYQAVKDMWKQNYQNLDVPEGMTGSRTDWIKDDIAGIDQTIALLSSPNQDKVQEGMDQVSNLLPFLLMGGFSQNEIVSYLQAKQDAAKEVSKTLAADEETKVSVTTRSAHTQKAMAASMDETPSTPATPPSVGTSGSTSDDEDDDSPLANLSDVSVTQPTSAPSSPAQPSNDILSAIDLKLPKLKDIATYESGKMKNDTALAQEREKVQSVLSKIADPDTITDPAEKAKFVQIREKLETERQNGNLTAAVVLTAAKRSSATVKQDKKSVLAQIANPSLATKETDKKRFTKLNETLTKASQEGNELATAILSTKDATSVEDIEKLSDTLKAQKDQAVAQSVLDELPVQNPVPEENKIQTVTQEEYDEIRKLWEDNYRTLPVPTEYGNDANGRIAWITADKKYIQETIASLKSADTAKQEDGMKNVSEIMPMLLLGGFSLQEVTGYLQAKSDAGDTVVAELQKDEESSVKVSNTTQAQQNTATMETEVPAENNDEKKNT